MKKNKRYEERISMLKKFVANGGNIADVKYRDKAIIDGKEVKIGKTVSSIRYKYNSDVMPTEEYEALRDMGFVFKKSLGPNSHPLLAKGIGEKYKAYRFNTFEGMKTMTGVLVDENGILYDANRKPLGLTDANIEEIKDTIIAVGLNNFRSTTVYNERKIGQWFYHHIKVKYDKKKLSPEVEAIFKYLRIDVKKFADGYKKPSKVVNYLVEELKKAFPDAVVDTEVKLIPDRRNWFDVVVTFNNPVGGFTKLVIEVDSGYHVDAHAFVNTFWNIKNESELDSKIKEVRRAELHRDEEISKFRKDGIAFIRVQDNEDVDYELNKFLETPDFFETHFTSREEYYPAIEVFFAECKREFKYRQERLKEKAEKKANRKRI